MQRTGSDPESMTAEDFICDFCRKCWADDRPMVEGHRGSLICGNCLSVAFNALWNLGAGDHVGETIVCTMCLSHNGDPVWRSPAFEESLICKRCAKQSVVMLERDPETTWKRPG